MKAVIEMILILLHVIVDGLQDGAGAAGLLVVLNGIILLTEVITRGTRRSTSHPLPLLPVWYHLPRPRASTPAWGHGQLQTGAMM